MNEHIPHYVDFDRFKSLENLSEPSMDLSLIHCGVEQCIPLHIYQQPRDEFIIHFVLKGKGIYLVDERSWPLGAGQAFLIYPHTDITYISDAKNPWKYTWIGFSGIKAENTLYHCGFSKSNLICDVPNVDIFQKLVSEMLEHKEPTFSNELYRNGKLMELFSCLVEGNRQKNNEALMSYSDNLNAYVRHAIEYIRKYHHKNISVSNLADTIGISQVYLNKCFQKELGVSVQRFIIDFRLNRAANLLASTSTPISEIAALVGYNDPLAFSKSFKKKFNESPTVYRKNYYSPIIYDVE